MILVTGGAGFIGSNLIHGLNRVGRSDIIAIDDLTEGIKYRNLLGAEILDYLDREELLKSFDRLRATGEISAVFHQGACSTTTEWDGRYMMQNNYAYSRDLFERCVEHRIPFIYASSAAVYGLGPDFCESSAAGAPLNVYGYSKLLFDQYVRQRLPRIKSQVVGLRYFNVYGPREGHKGNMASVAWHFYQQAKADEAIRLFQGSGGYADGEQRRDFVYVDDVVAVNLWFLQHTGESGIFNVGAGRSQSFNDVAEAIIGWRGVGEIEYIPFPDHLKGSYQSFTLADIEMLHKVGYTEECRTVEQGVPQYLDWLAAADNAQVEVVAKRAGPRVRTKKR